MENGLYCIERIEGEFAVCENESRQSVNVLLSSLYSNAKAGDWFLAENNSFYFCEEKTAEMRNKNLDLLKKIMGNK